MASIAAESEGIPTIIVTAELSNSPKTISPVHYAAKNVIAGFVSGDLEDECREDLGDRLSNKIRDSSIGLHGTDRYLPDVYYETWLSKESIEQVLGPDIPKIVEFILEKAKRAFAAVLITIGDGNSRQDILKSFYVHGFSDDDLPITASDMRSLEACLGKVRSNCEVHCNDIVHKTCNEHATRLNTFHHKHWSMVNLNIFATNQWKFLVQNFSQNRADPSGDKFRFTLEDERILPFKHVELALSANGHFSHLYSAQMLAAYKSGKEQNGETIPIALKQLSHIPTPGFDLHEEWIRECDAYYLMNKRENPNIVSGICGFKQRDSYYIVLEWANGGNFRDLWKELPGPHLDGSSDLSIMRSRSFVKRVFEQLRGLVDAIKTMHSQGGEDPTSIRDHQLSAVNLALPDTQRQVQTTTFEATSQPAYLHDIENQSSSVPKDDSNWRHGDIKPDNILRFVTSSSDRIGTMKLADLGRAKANYDATMLRQNESENEMFATVFYEPPDLYLRITNGEPRRISRLFDIWSIGCVTWETILWLAYGLPAVSQFVSDSMEGNIKRNYSKSTPYWAKMSNEDRAYRSVVLEKWFDLFLGIEEKQHNAIHDLVKVLKEKVFIIELHRNSMRYHPRYRTTAKDFLFELDQILVKGGDENSPYWYDGFDYRAPERFTRSSAPPPSAPELSHNNKFWRSDVHLSAPTDFKSHATAIANGNEYTQPFRNEWEYELDDDDRNDCATKLLQSLGSTHKENKPQQVCNYCKHFNRLGEELTISSETLDTNAYDIGCALCELIDGALSVERTNRSTTVESGGASVESSTKDSGTKSQNRKQGSDVADLQGQQNDELADKSVVVSTNSRRPSTSTKSRINPVGAENCPIPSLDGELTFITSRAGIHLKGCERPLLRICQTSTVTSNSSLENTYRKGFPSLPKDDSTEYYEVLKGMVDHCGSRHNCVVRGKLSASDGQAADLPTRLLDLRSKYPRIIDTKDLSGREKQDMRYTALSYKWGREPFLKSTRNNIESHKKRIRPTELPKTFLHAIKVTKELGLHFLWVDSLCILQGPDGDFDAEAERMQFTFGGAYCVLAACVAEGPKEGFLPVGREDRCTRIGESDNWASTVIDDFERDVLQSPLCQRGWVFQERALARRSLFFTQGQTYFECGAGIRSESLGLMKNSIVAFLGDSDFPKYAESSDSSRGGQADLIAYTFELYSCLKFSFPYDRPVAIDGLVQRMATSFRDQHVAGMFGSFWGRCLLWERARDQKQLQRIVFSEAGPGRVPKVPPSWSWMAYDGAINFLKIEGSSLKWNEDIKRPLMRTQTSWPKMHRRRESKALLAPACILDNGCFESKDTYLRYDERDASETPATHCVIIGTTKTPILGTMKKHHILLIRRQENVASESHYERIGVGIVPKSYVFATNTFITIN